MKIRMMDSLAELKAYFGFEKIGVILEEDIDLVENPTDWYERKRRDAETLTTIAANVRDKIMDIGTSTGRSAFKFASNLAPGGQVFTVNLLPEQYENDAQLVTHLISRDEIGNYFRNRGYRNVEQLYANTLTWDVPDSLKDFDAVFVDGAHDTHAVFSDSMKFWPRIKEGGFLLWHDFSPIHRGKHHWIEAVMKGVEQFCGKMGIESEIINLRESWVGILRKPVKSIPVPVSKPATVQPSDQLAGTTAAKPGNEARSPKPFQIPDAVKKLRYLVAYTAHENQRAMEEERHLARLRGYGFDVEGFCVAVPVYSPHWGFEKLDREWKAGSPGLMDMYDRLQARLDGKDVFVSWTGAMIHPDFLKRISTYNVYVCSDDPDSSNQLSRPVAPYFDYSFTRNVACLDLYRSWGVRNVEWLCPPVDPDFTWPELTEEGILHGKRDLDSIMFCERVYGISDRPQRIERLIREFPQTFVRGKGWPGGFASQAEIVDAYKRARIGWNLHNSIGPTNSRVTALPGFGIMQICDNKSHLGRIFKLDEEVVGFDTIDECIDKTRYYLAHEDERRRIALAGWRRAKLDYSEPRQWERILSLIADGAIRKLKLEPGPGRISLATRAMAAEPPLKLNLGCGMAPLKGYLNIDNDPKAKADLFLDFREILRHQKKAAVSEAVLIDSLGALSLWDARTLFRDLNELLIPGGRLIIETPDAERIMEKMRRNMGHNLAEYLEGVRALHGFDLENLNRKTGFNPTAFTWTAWHLGVELRQAGFADIRVLTVEGPQPGNGQEDVKSWRDVRIEAVKSVSVPSEKKGPDASHDGFAAVPTMNTPQKTAQLQPAAAPGSKGKIFCLYDSMMGHVTCQTRGLMFKDEYLRRGWDIRFLDYRHSSPEDILRNASECDITYTLKVADLALYKTLKQQTRTKIVFDLTDALWTPVHQQAGWTDLDAILRLSDAIFSENEWVCAYGRKFTDKVFSIPVCLQAEKFDAIKATLPPRDPDSLVVGWVGSNGTVHSLELVRDALEKLSHKYRDLEFRILGCSDPLALPEFKDVVFTVLPEYNEEIMMKEMLNMDVGIFPAPFGLEDYAIRGGQKSYLYMVAGAVPVCHNVGDCAAKIKDGVTGMLVGKPEEWYAKLDALLGDKEMRRRMGRAASHEIRNGHSMEAVFTVLENSLLAVMGKAGK